MTTPQLRKGTLVKLFFSLVEANVKLTAELEVIKEKNQRLLDQVRRFIIDVTRIGPKIYEFSLRPWETRTAKTRLRIAVQPKQGSSIGGILAWHAGGRRFESWQGQIIYI